MSARIVSSTTYVIVFVVLIVLTMATVLASSAPLGRWHASVALSIAACKAILVILFFMHVLYGGRLTWIVIAGALLWLAILLVLTMTDYLTRSWLV